MAVRKYAARVGACSISPQQQFYKSEIRHKKKELVVDNKIPDQTPVAQATPLQIYHISKKASSRQAKIARTMRRNHGQHVFFGIKKSEDLDVCQCTPESNVQNETRPITNIIPQTEKIVNG